MESKAMETMDSAMSSPDLRGKTGSPRNQAQQPVPQEAPYETVGEAQA